MVKGLGLQAQAVAVWGRAPGLLRVTDGIQ